MSDDYKIRLSICDSDENFAGILRDRILDSEVGHEFSVKIYNSGAETLENKYQFEAMIINDGISDISVEEMAKQLRLEYDIPVVFIAENEGNIDTYIKLRPFRYITKTKLDDDFDDMIFSLERFINHLSRRHVVNLYSQNGKKQVFIEDIVYAEINGNQILFNMTDKSIVISETSFDSYKEIWDNEAFVRCHRRYVINCARVVKIEGNNAFLEDGSKIAISKQRLKDVKKVYNGSTRII